MKNIAVILVLLVGLTAGFWWWSGEKANVATAQQTDSATGEGAATEMVAVTFPELEGSALRGQGYFQAVCAACHGPNAGGVDGSGPPLIHKIYEPSHHGDMAIILAVRRGVQSHHWRFGNMAPVEGITDADLVDIITFIRLVQQANGIT